MMIIEKFIFPSCGEVHEIYEIFLTSFVASLISKNIDRWIYKTVYVNRARM